MLDTDGGPGHDSIMGWIIPVGTKVGLVLLKQGNQSGAPGSVRSPLKWGGLTEMFEVMMGCPARGLSSAQLPPQHLGCNQVKTPENGDERADDGKSLQHLASEHNCSRVLQAAWETKWLPHVTTHVPRCGVYTPLLWG